MIKKNKLGIIPKLSEISRIPFDTISGYPIMQLFGNRELLIEGTTSILSYDERKTKLLANKLTLTICGERITLKSLSDENLLISGIISAIEFE